jgi:hypothetical protein
MSRSSSVFESFYGDQVIILISVTWPLVATCGVVDAGDATQSVCQSKQFVSRTLRRNRQQVVRSYE